MATFKANISASDARLDFTFGSESGSVWLDDIHITEHPADVFLRQFSSGVVVVNGTPEVRTIPVGQNLARIVGTQAPKLFAVLDDADAGFSGTGTWTETTDSGDWAAVAPFYHNWRPGMRTLDGEGEATLNLSIPAGTDRYTIDAWWPAAPTQSSYADQAIYEVVANGLVVATATLAQTATGDEWHRIAAEISLAAADHPKVRLRNGGAGTLIADALLLQSTARYNDGAAVNEFELAPFDAIVLKRTSGGCP